MKRKTNFSKAKRRQDITRHEIKMVSIPIDIMQCLEARKMQRTLQLKNDKKILKKFGISKEVKINLGEKMSGNNLIEKYSDARLLKRRSEGENLTPLKKTKHEKQKNLEQRFLGSCNRRKSLQRRTRPVKKDYEDIIVIDDNTSLSKVNNNYELYNKEKVIPKRSKASFKVDESTRVNSELDLRIKISNKIFTKNLSTKLETADKHKLKELRISLDSEDCEKYLSLQIKKSKLNNLSELRSQRILKEETLVESKTPLKDCENEAKSFKNDPALGTKIESKFRVYIDEQNIGQIIQKDDDQQTGGAKQIEQIDKIDENIKLQVAKEEMSPDVKQITLINPSNNSAVKSTKDALNERESFLKIIRKTNEDKILKDKDDSDISSVIIDKNPEVKVGSYYSETEEQSTLKKTINSTVKKSTKGVLNYSAFNIRKESDDDKDNSNVDTLITELNPKVLRGRSSYLESRKQNSARKSTRGRCNYRVSNVTSSRNIEVERVVNANNSDIDSLITDLSPEEDSSSYSKSERQNNVKKPLKNFARKSTGGSINYKMSGVKRIRDVEDEGVSYEDNSRVDSFIADLVEEEEVSHYSESRPQDRLKKFVGSARKSTKGCLNYRARNLEKDSIRPKQSCARKSSKKPINSVMLEFNRSKRPLIEQMSSGSSTEAENKVNEKYFMPNLNKDKTVVDENYIFKDNKITLRQRKGNQSRLKDKNQPQTLLPKNFSLSPLRSSVKPLRRQHCRKRHLSNSPRKTKMVPTPNIKKEEKVDDFQFNLSRFSVLDVECLTQSFDHLVCSKCFKHVNVKFPSSMDFPNTEFNLRCNFCNHLKHFKRSKTCFNELNFSVSGFDSMYLRLTFSCLDFGGGYEQLKSTCIALNIPQLNFSTYSKYCRYIIDQSKLKLDVLLKLAGETVHKTYKSRGIQSDENGVRNINIKYDSTWMTKGKFMKYGVVIAIDLTTGLVLDFHLMCKHCAKCSAKKCKKQSNFDEWSKRHKENNECQINYHASSSEMALNGSLILNQRSVQLHKLRYNAITNNDDNLISKISNVCEDKGLSFQSKKSCIENQNTSDNSKYTDPSILNSSSDCIGNHSNEQDEELLKSKLERECHVAVNKENEGDLIKEKIHNTENSNINMNKVSKTILNAEETAVNPNDLSPHGTNCSTEGVSSVELSKDILSIEEDSNRNISVLPDPKLPDPVLTTCLKDIDFMNYEKEELELSEKSPNHVLEEINISLALDLGSPNDTSAYEPSTNLFNFIDTSSTEDYAISLQKSISKNLAINTNESKNLKDSTVNLTSAGINLMEDGNNVNSNSKVINEPKNLVSKMEDENNISSQTDLKSSISSAVINEQRNTIDLNFTSLQGEDTSLKDVNIPEIKNNEAVNEDNFQVISSLSHDSASKVSRQLISENQKNTCDFLGLSEIIENEKVLNEEAIIKINVSKSNEDQSSYSSKTGMTELLEEKMDQTSVQTLKIRDTSGSVINVLENIEFEKIHDPKPENPKLLKENLNNVSNEILGMNICQDLEKKKAKTKELNDINDGEKVDKNDELNFDASLPKLSPSTDRDIDSLLSLYQSIEIDPTLSNVKCPEESDLIGKKNVSSKNKETSELAESTAKQNDSKQKESFYNVKHSSQNEIEKLLESNSIVDKHTKPVRAKSNDNKTGKLLQDKSIGNESRKSVETKVIVNEYSKSPEVKSTDNKNEKTVQAESTDYDNPVEYQFPENRKLLQSICADNEKLVEFEYIDSKNPVESESVDNGNQVESESVDNGNQVESESIISKNPVESKSIDSENPIESEFIFSENPEKSKSIDNEKLIESESNDKDKPVEVESTDKTNPVETASMDSVKPVEAASIDNIKPVETISTDNIKPIGAEFTDNEKPIQIESIDSKNPIEAESTDNYKSVEAESTDNYKSVEAESSGSKSPMVVESIDEESLRLVEAKDIVDESRRPVEVKLFHGENKQSEEMIKTVVVESRKTVGLKFNEAVDEKPVETKSTDNMNTKLGEMETLTNELRPAVVEPSDNRNEKSLKNELRNNNNGKLVAIELADFEKEMSAAETQSTEPVKGKLVETEFSDNGSMKSIEAESITNGKRKSFAIEVIQNKSKKLAKFETVNETGSTSSEIKNFLECETETENVSQNSESKVNESMDGLLTVTEGLEMFGKGCDVNKINSAENNQLVVPVSCVNSFGNMKTKKCAENSFEHFEAMDFKIEYSDNGKFSDSHKEKENLHVEMEVDDEVTSLDSYPNESGLSIHSGNDSDLKLTKNLQSQTGEDRGKSPISDSVTTNKDNKESKIHDSDIKHPNGNKNSSLRAPVDCEKETTEIEVPVNHKENIANDKSSEKSNSKNNENALKPEGKLVEDHSKVSIEAALKRVKKETLRGSIWRKCNSGIIYSKDIVEFACNQAIITHNISIKQFINKKEF